jgi:hypothetical protein
MAITTCQVLASDYISMPAKDRIIRAARSQQLSRLVYVTGDSIIALVSCNLGLTVVRTYRSNSEAFVLVAVRVALL